jgi:3-oxoacyl-[acyl-carrier-protein] synthase-1
MTPRPLTIVGSGMVTGVGLNAPSSCAAIRCGINNFQETRFMDSSGEWIVGSEVPFEEPWRGTEKLGRMLAAVVAESFETDPDLVPEETPIIACFAERKRPGRVDDLEERVLESAERYLGFEMHPSSMTVSQGRVGGTVALREARKMLYEQKAAAIVVAGVDSYLSAQTLGEFESKRRLLTAANSNGFVPGEGASAVVVKRPGRDVGPKLVLMGLGFGVEQSTINSDKPLRADGLLQAVKASLDDAGVKMEWLDYRITDVSGEQYGFKEASLMLARLLRTHKDEFEIWHAADCIGEIGAAAGPAALNVAWYANKKDYSMGTNMLCHFGNDDGKRGVAIVSYQ